MKNYNLYALSSDEFEELSVDLQSNIEKITYSKTNVGADEGIDGYVYNNKRKLQILQSKKYSSKNSLNQQMKIEKVKIEKLKEKPQKYVLYTTCKLQLKDKKKIQEIMKPYIESINDINDYSDINNLISNQPEIELKYYKLWISSTNVMVDTFERIFNRRIYEINKIKKEEKKKVSIKYVATKHLSSAIEILEKSNVVIISGMPGVGKTTLANAIAIIYENRNYEYVNIEKIEDYFNFKINDDKKYVFFFDDFLGTIDYEISNEKEARQIISVIKKINAGNKNNKLIITTREFVLSEGKQKSEALDNFLETMFKLMIDMKEYTKKEKMDILIKHIEYYSIQTPQIRRFIEEKKLLRIINHQNYFPRIIDQTFEFYDYSDKNLVDEVIANLDDSSRIWKSIFENKLKVIDIKIMSYIYFSSFILNHFSLLEQLTKLGFNRDDILSSVKRLEKPLNLLKLTKQKEKGLIINFFDPSIKDYMKRYIREHISLASFMVDSNIDINNINNFARLYMSYENLLSDYPNIYNDLVNCFILKLQQLLDKEKGTKLQFIGMTISLMSFDASPFYLNLKLNDKIKLKEIFEMIKNSKSDNTDCIKILCDISMKLKTNDVKEYVSEKLDKFIEKSNEYNYTYFIEWKEYFERYDKFEKVKNRILDIENEIDYEEVENDDIDRKIDSHNDAIGYLEEFKEWYDDKKIEDYISNRENIIDELRNNYQTKDDYYEESLDFSDLVTTNKNDGSDEAQLVDYFTEYFKLKDNDD